MYGHMHYIHIQHSHVLEEDVHEVISDVILSEGAPRADCSECYQSLAVVVAYLGVFCKGLLGHPLDGGGDGALGLVQELLFYVH